MNADKTEIDMSAGDRISNVAQQWFLYEPVLFSIYCTHEIRENSQLKIPFRTGGGLIEYNPALVDEVSKEELTGRLKVETLRILLKHPYLRKPFRARPEILYLASNMTIYDNLNSARDLHFELVPLKIRRKLPSGKTFEEYYGLLNQMIPPMQSEESELNEDGDTGQEGSSGSEGGEQSNEGGDAGQEGSSGSDSGNQSKEDGDAGQEGSSGSEGGEQSNDAGSSGEQSSPGSGGGDPMTELLKQCAEAASTWEEDSINTDTINTIIESTLNGPKSLWGTMKGNFIELVKASLVPPVNIANILKGFKKTILSQRRDLTRMRPSRRYGFEQMGSKRSYTTQVLVAIDTSGSVNSQMLRRMLGLVNRIFTQGIERIDVLQFDTELQGLPEPIKKKINHIEIKGRGGTDFQPAADFYIEHSEYDGLIYITDGDASNPEIPPQHKRLPVTWIITDDDLIPTIRHGWEGSNY